MRELNKGNGKRISTICNKIYNKCYSLRAWIIGFITIKRIIRNNSGMKLLLTDIGVGDQVFMLAYVEKWATLYNIEQWRLVTPNSKIDLYKCFSISDDRQILVSDRLCHMLNLFCVSGFGYRFRKNHPEVLFVNAFGYFRGDRLLTSPCLFSFSMLTKAVYKIPQDTEPHEWMGRTIVDKQIILYKYKIDVPEKTVLINPYANSCNKTPFSFFQKIADLLIRRGYPVICSVIGNQVPLEGTRGISFSLDEALTICEACNAVIGARSGFMDLVAFTSNKIICIDNRNYDFSDLFCLESCWPKNHNIRTIYYDESDENSEIEQIAEYVQNDH